ncbi:hypothetical protein [Pantoea stewartii]|uniref:hypothetical protein n=1 Tax=Pantoea stewartii TaxID=66269 RepID=UPI0037037482
MADDHNNDDSAGAVNQVLRMALGFCDPYLSEAAAQSPRRKTQAKRKLSINTFNADDELSAVIIFIISLRLI